MLSKIDLNIIIVNWNVKDLLRKCLKSIYETTSRVSFEIFVVDNASTDGSVEMVKEEFPQVKSIANKENLGFPKANNQAIRMSSGPNILLLNPDTVVLQDSLKLMVRYLDTHPETGVVGPKILNPDGSIQYSCARQIPKFYHSLFEVTLLSKLFPQSKLFNSRNMGWWDHNSSRDVECLCGACIMFKKGVFEKVGLLDEKIFMYMEDTEICYRVLRAGFKIHYLSNAKIIHWGGKSSLQTDMINGLPLINAYSASQTFISDTFGIVHGTLYRLGIIFGSLCRMTILFIAVILQPFLQKPNKYTLCTSLVKYFNLFLWSIFLKRAKYR